MSGVRGAPKQVYYQPVVGNSKDGSKTEIARIVAEHPTYGYRRITAMLHREGQVVNNKRVRRLMRAMGLAAQCPKNRCRTTHSNHELPRYPNRVEGLVIERPDQLWVGDMTYVKLGSEFVDLAVLMDVFTRSIRGWQLASSMEVELTLVVLKRALAKGRGKSIIRIKGCSMRQRNTRSCWRQRGLRSAWQR